MRLKYIAITYFTYYMIICLKSCFLVLNHDMLDLKKKVINFSFIMRNYLSSWKFEFVSL